MNNYQCLIIVTDNLMNQQGKYGVGLVVSVSASHTVGRGFASRPGHTKDHHKNGTNCLPALQPCVRITLIKYHLYGNVYVESVVMH